MKKRERTVNLIGESETLETQNVDFKNQIRELETQRRKLMDILQAHSPHCVHQGGYQPLPSVSTLKNCKYLNELQNYCDGNQSQQVEQPEIKYSHTLKAAQEMVEYPEFKMNALLPHGYCKPSPTDNGYVLSPDSGFVKSPVDLDSSSQYSDHIPTQNTMHLQHQHHHHPHSHHLKSNNYIPTNNNAILTNNNNNVNSLNHNLNGDSELFLKTELIDTSSPYTTMQSADRFLFENTDTQFDSDKVLMHCTGIIDNAAHIVANSTIIGHAGQMLMDNFDASIIKADFLSQNQEFNIVMGDGTETQFTDLDSGIIKSLNNGCLV